MYMSMYMHLHMHMYNICVWISICISICIRTCIHIHTYMYIHKQRNKQTNKQTYIHTYARTYVCLTPSKRARTCNNAVKVAILETDFHFLAQIYALWYPLHILLAKIGWLCLYKCVHACKHIYIFYIHIQMARLWILYCIWFGFLYVVFFMLVFDAWCCCFNVATVSYMAFTWTCICMHVCTHVCMYAMWCDVMWCDVM